MKGAKLRERRQALGLTQQRLADRLEVSRNTIARWEREERAIPGFLDLALKTIEREKPRKSSTRNERTKRSV